MIMNFEQLKAAIEDYKKSILMNEYLNFIVDENVSLAERWGIFQVAPPNWKMTDTYIPHFESEELLVSGEIVWYNDFYVERHQTVNCSDWISNLEDAVKHEDEDRIKAGWSMDVVDSFKREILKRNLGSFIYDW